MKQKGMTLYTLDNEVIDLLEDRIKDEYYAHFFYQNAANYCRDVNYLKAETFFSKESEQELNHAKTIQNYLVDFNVIPKIDQTKTTFEFTSLPQIIYDAYRMELNLMWDYAETSQSLFSKDIITFDFLTEFRKLQKNSVIEYNNLINALNLIDVTNNFQILYFEQTYFN